MFSEAHALIIAVADYHHARKLPKSVLFDAQDFSALLLAPERCGYDPTKVQLLLDGEATREAVFAALDRLRKVAEPGDTVCIYFSGHGWRSKDSDESFLLPVDASRDALETNAISASLFSERLDAIKAGRLLVFLDACHAGGAGTIKDGFSAEEEERYISAKAIEVLSEGVGRAIIASSRVDETSLILPAARNSAFTSALLEGLEGAADFQNDGLIKLFSLYDYVAERVPELTNDRQHPMLRTKLEKNFAIALSPRRSLDAEVAVQTAARWRDRLQIVLSALYPAGPTDRDVWERAGGDLSQLTLGKSGRSMWFEALKLLVNGGGGDINVNGLVAEALKDFPQNTHLLALL